MPIFYEVCFPAEDSEGGVLREYFTSKSTAKAFAYATAKNAKLNRSEDMIAITRLVYKNILNALNHKHSEYKPILTYYVERKASSNHKSLDELSDLDFTVIRRDRGEG